MNADEKRLYRMKADIIKAIAHPLRLAVVEFLRDGEKCVCDIVERLGAGQPNVSRHLSLMVKAGVLSNRKEGLKVYYSLRWNCVANFLLCVEGVIREQCRATEAVMRMMGRNSG